MRLFLLCGGVALAASVVAYVTWQVGMRWLLDHVGVEGDDVPLAEPERRFTGFVPALREQTAKRRAAADSIRRRAARVEAGAPVADVLKLVRK